MDGYLVDTSVLRVFTSINRMDILANWMPLSITPSILAEHGLSPRHARAALDEALRKGIVRIDSPALRREAKVLSESNPSLSFVDAESILFAQQKGYAVFVADVAYLLECKKRHVPTTGVASVLLALRRSAHLKGAELIDLVNTIEDAGYYLFSADERHGLGL